MPRFKYILLFISISNLSKNYLYPLVEYWVEVSTLKYVWISKLQVSNLQIKRMFIKIPSMTETERELNNITNYLHLKKAHFPKQT
jgi:hypothetical protein